MAVHYRKLALASAILLALSACKDDVKPVAEVRPVRFTIAGSSNSHGALQFSGEVRARQESRLAFRVAGKITQKRVSNGERVHKGQVLAVLDSSDYQLDSSAKAAQLSAAAANLQQQEADLKRYRELLAQSFISQTQVDRQQAAVSTARASLQQAQAALNASRNQSSYTNLLADSDGIVSDIQAEPGMVVAAGQVVARLAADGAREVLFQVPENAVTAVSHVGAFKVALWADGRELDATLRELAGDADPATRTYAARLQLNGNMSGVQLGMTALISAQTAGQQAAIHLPPTAILDENGKHYVWQINGDKVGRKPVTIAGIDSSSVTVSAGLRGGEKIVTAGVHLLHDGQRVSLLQP